MYNVFPNDRRLSKKLSFFLQFNIRNIYKNSANVFLICYNPFTKEMKQSDELREIRFFTHR